MDLRISVTKLILNRNVFHRTLFVCDYRLGLDFDLWFFLAAQSYKDVENSEHKDNNVQYVQVGVWCIINVESSQEDAVYPFPDWSFQKEEVVSHNIES